MRATVILSLLLLSTTSAAAELRVSHAFESSVPRGSVRRVVVDIPTGEIHIRNGAPGVLTVSGTASREPDSARSRETQQRIVNDTTVEIYASNEEAIVRRRFGPEAKGFSGETFTKYEVTLAVPPGISLEVLTRAGEVKIDGSYGNVDVDLRAGEIEIRTPRSAVRDLLLSVRIGEVRANLGRETLTKEGLFPGKVRFRGTGQSNIRAHVTTGEVDVVLTE
jgi:hypothetical protein